MEHIHYAAVDIGSNAVRLLIKRLDDASSGRFSKDVMMRVPLRLGQDVFTKGNVGAKKLNNLVELMRAYSIVMGIYRVESCNRRICATCALREAANADRIVEQIGEATGFNVEIISGQEEASIVCGLSSPDDKRKLIYVDVGGGSTEVSIMGGGKIFGRKSYPIGTVRMINGLTTENWKQILAADLRKSATEFALRNVSSGTLTNAVIVGAGGNINKLFSMAQERDTAGRTMSVESLRSLYMELAAMSVEQRMTKLKLKPDRADVIVPAAEIFLAIADTLAISEIEIPTDGLADGIILDLWRRQNKSMG